MTSHPELLVGMSVEELEALAEALLAPSAQSRLDNLLAEQKERPLSQTEERELDALVQKVDQLTILKTRAKFTLHHQQTATRTCRSIFPWTCNDGSDNISALLRLLSNR